MCSDKTPGTPTGWKTPGDVMKLHRLKIKQKALNARLTGNSTSQSSSKLPSRNVTEKTINPFRKCSSTVNLGTSQSSNKRSRADLEEEEVSNDDGGTLFCLLGGKSKSDNIENISSFENILSKISNPAKTVKKQDLSQGFDQVPLDWTLRSKMRFMSRKPFPWNQKLKTCEEASGITGFVRCVDTDPSVNTGASCSNLDTSPNAQFLTTCMFWQHPHLPWLQLFPRSRLKGPTAGGTSTINPGGPTLSTGVAASQAGGPTVLSADMKAALHRDWIKSFMSLFHLLRAKQCPYFYLISNSFTCLFRAAGIGGHTELHAILTPTTRGFRHLLRAEDIEFTMPLKKPDSTSSTNTESSTKRKKTSDPTLEPLEQTQMETFSDDEDIEEDRTEDWLKEMGVTSTDIRRIQSTQSDLRMGEEREIDRTPESLIYVQGTEAQALFNFLVNCKSCVATTGYLTGVPPTLISPVCFHSASLQYLQVKDSTVRLEGDIYYSMEVRGPILPHTVQYLCQLLEKSQDSFSLTFASVESTKPFSQIKSEHSQDLPPSCQSKEGTNLLSPRRNASSSIFEQQNLSDCGLRKNLISKFCSQNSIRSYESVKYSDKSYRIV
ncbi:hypothetical protein M8J77_025986 [Diaphorina citri]|nr:hypothetical protein M8J77_025986 [Diaphorina citri]